jgi:SAM-dependent methyltransferase
LEAILCGLSEQEFWKTGEQDASRLLRFIDDSSVVLDVGCGISRVMKFIAPNCREIIGVDTSSLILRRAKRELTNFKNCHFYRHDFKKFDVFPPRLFLSHLLVLHVAAHGKGRCLHVPQTYATFAQT